MHATTDITFSTAAIRAVTWQERKEDYAAMMAAVRSGDMGDAQRAYESLIAGRTISPISPLAVLGSALQSGDAATVEQAARTLHQVRTGHSYRHRSRTDAAAPITGRKTHGRRSRLVSTALFEHTAGAY